MKILFFVCLAIFVIHVSGIHLSAGQHRAQQSVKHKPHLLPAVVQTSFVNGRRVTMTLKETLHNGKAPVTAQQRFTLAKKAHAVAQAKPKTGLKLKTTLECKDTGVLGGLDNFGYFMCNVTTPINDQPTVSHMPDLKRIPDDVPYENIYDPRYGIVCRLLTKPGSIANHIAASARISFVNIAVEDPVVVRDAVVTKLANDSFEITMGPFLTVNELVAQIQIAFTYTKKSPLTASVCVSELMDIVVDNQVPNFWLSTFQQLSFYDFNAAFSKKRVVDTRTHPTSYPENMAVIYVDKLNGVLSDGQSCIDVDKLTFTESGVVKPAFVAVESENTGVDGVWGGVFVETYRCIDSCSKSYGYGSPINHNTSGIDRASLEYDTDTHAPGAVDEICHGYMGPGDVPAKRGDYASPLWETELPLIFANNTWVSRADGMFVFAGPDSYTESISVYKFNACDMSGNCVLATITLESQVSPSPVMPPPESAGASVLLPALALLFSLVSAMLALL